MSESEKMKAYEEAIGEIKRHAKFQKGLGNDAMDAILDECDVLELMEQE